VAFTVVLVTNIFVVIAAVRCRRPPGEQEPVQIEAAIPATAVPTLPLTPDAAAEAAEG